MGINEKLFINDDGIALVKNADGSTKLAIANPWATDINKKELKTWYSIENGNILNPNNETPQNLIKYSKE